MSMLFNLRRVNDEELEALIREPSDIFFFLYGSEPYVPKKSFFARLLDANKEAAPKREWKAPADDMILDLGKNWHILHYLFCKCPWEGPLPQATLMSGGVEIGNIDVGYGPARGLRPSDVNAFLGFLDALKENEFGANVSKKDVEENEIYYQGWSQDHGQPLWEYVVELRQFLQKAEDENNGVILYLY